MSVAVAPAAVLKPLEAPAAKVRHSSRSHPNQLDQACREFENDREFEKTPPTREQVARAMVAAKYRKLNQAETPTHLELVAALKELFPEYRKRPAGVKPITPDKK